MLTVDLNNEKHVCFAFHVYSSSKPSDVARSILSGDHNKSQQPQQLTAELCEELTRRKTLEANSTLSSSASTTSDIPFEAAKSSIADNNKNGNNDNDNENENVNNILRKAIAKLQRKMQEPTKKKFYLHTRLETHILPLTNVAFDRSGEHCLTGSYDRTCRIINTHNGTEEHVLGDHDNVVFSVAYNFPKW